MTSWTIHLPPDGAGDISDAERFVAIKDGLRPFAIVFGPLWFVAKRLWLGALGVLLIEAALIGATWLIELPRPAVAVLQGLFHILVGLEASTIQRWTLNRSGWREVGAVSGHGRREAEVRAAAMIADAVDGAPVPSPRLGIAGQSQARSAAIPSVLGLFPEAKPR